jgi:ABC-type transport system involved in cytochrome c biogenesis permease subunit
MGIRACPPVPIMPGHWSYIALALYVTSLVLYLRYLYTGRRLTGQLATVVLALGLLGHYLALLERSHWVHSVPYDDLYGSLSLFGWLLATTYLGLELYYRQRSVGAFVVPCVLTLFAIGTWSGPDLSATRQEQGTMFALHVTLSVWAYAAFALAFVLSTVYLIEHRYLRRRRPGRVVWRFPPLEGLERMSRGSVRVGLVSLVAGTVLGILWQWRLRHHFLITDPKVLVTLAILVLYALYLRLSTRGAWRGARASLVCVLTFLLVIFSYAVVNVYLSQFHRYL